MIVDIEKLREIKNPRILVIGNHAGIIQSMLDFDFLAGKQQPSVVAVVGGQRKNVKYFWGVNETRIKSYQNIGELEKDTQLLEGIDLFVMADSGRRALASVTWAIRSLPSAQGGIIFAESVPERHALAIRELAEQKKKFVFGPASVGVMVPGVFKLGAIAGTQPEQIIDSGSLTKGSIAIISSSGGMINEIISFAARRGLRLSFAGAVGGERFPIVKPVDIIKAVLDDKDTKTILYFGELGGRDEYEVADLIQSRGEGSKKVIAYIAGSAAENFENAPQFGHAKALAKDASETASAKREYMKKKGITVAKDFADFETIITNIEASDTSSTMIESEMSAKIKQANMGSRQKRLFTSSVSSDSGDSIKILNEPLLDFVSSRGLSEIALGMFLGHEPKSKTLVEFFDLTLRLLVDHGPQVSGVVNTMITARAGKDLPSALAAGLLTIGPRFGGAIDGAAAALIRAVKTGMMAPEFVEMYAKNKEYIPGIGHKKYRADKPDPRVSLLMEKFDHGGKVTAFAKEVAQITSNKKAQLILNVDGAVAALLIDTLLNEEDYSYDDVDELIKTEFCNAIFVYARSVGLIAHYLDQRRIDDDLFRLPDDSVGSLH